MVEKVPIKIYYHVTLINEWYAITDEIFRAIIWSDLYDEAESISIGVLGNKSEIAPLEEFISAYPKFKIVRYHEDVSYFEFHTISKLKEDADNSSELFYALYLHSKSVMTPKENIPDMEFKAFWRQYMTYFMVTEWRKCYHALDLRDLDDHHEGYDAVGCRMVPARKSIGGLTHASGNFWWANSEYIKSLKIVLADTYYDGQNRYNGGHSSEVWVWSGQPIIYCPTFLFQMGFPHDKGTFKEYFQSLPDKEKYIL